jgi:hypothetical protein
MLGETKNNISLFSITDDNSLIHIHSIQNNRDYQVTSGKVLYMINPNAENFSSYNLIELMPELPEGNHNITKMKFTSLNSTAIKMETWFLFVTVQNKLINVSVPGNVTSAQICGAIGGKNGLIIQLLKFVVL